MPILFEWYKYIGGLCAILASIPRNSPVIREITPLNYGILIGLLNRCARLMLSNMRLGVTNKYGETIMLLDRSIYESLVTIQWLCNKNNDERFRRYLADSVKSDLILRDHIQQSISKRGGNVLIIENQMLSSIQKCAQNLHAYLKNKYLKKEASRFIKHVQRCRVIGNILYRKSTNGISCCSWFLDVFNNSLS